MCPAARSFVVSLVDSERSVRTFADFCLHHLLAKKHPAMFFAHFIECIFHFNNYRTHPAYNRFAQTQREQTLFSLEGDGENAEKRRVMYV